MEEEIKTFDIDEALASLSSKQYAWFIGMLEGKTDIAAYRAAYDAENMNDAQCSIEAHRLRNNPKIAELIIYMRMNGIYQAIDDRLSHLRRLRELSARAESTGNFGAAVNAEVSAGKVEGHYIERREDVTPTKARDDWHEEFEKFTRIDTPKTVQ